MIVVTISDDEVKLEGHAGYAPRGYDIVCEAVSILTQTLAVSLSDETITAIKPGFFSVDRTQATQNDEILINAFINGLRLLAGYYKDHIQITKKI